MARQQRCVPVELLRDLFHLGDHGALLYADGTHAGHRRKDGYHMVYVAGNGKFLVHRIVFALANGHWPTKVIDHIDGDPSNNDPENLRECLHMENQRNRRNGNKNNSSGVQGVIWDKARKLWAVQIHTCGKNKHFGRWESLELAELIATEARNRLFGAFAPVLS